MVHQTQFFLNNVSVKLKDNFLPTIIICKTLPQIAPNMIPHPLMQTTQNEQSKFYVKKNVPGWQPTYISIDLQAQKETE